MSRWPIGAHYCRHAYQDARALGVSFTWLHADGLGADPRSREIHDAAGVLESGLRYVLTLDLRRPGTLMDGPAWREQVAGVQARLQQAGALDRCLAVQLDDEYYTWMWAQGFDLHEVSVHVARRADDVRAIFGPAVGLGVGMAETGAVQPPTVGIDWWGLNVYLAEGYFRRAGDVAALYAAAVRLGRPIMPVLPVFADHHRPPLTLDVLARCYLPLLDRHAAAICAVGIFALHHPSQYAPDLHPEGRGVLELGQPYAAGVRYLTEVYGGG